MTFDERQEAFCAGLEIGMALRCNLDATEASHEVRHAAVKPIVTSVVADMNRRGVGDHEARQKLRRAREIEACERFKAESIPWPAEAGEPE